MALPMPERTPAETLAAAADRLDALIAEATPGPWTAISSNGRKDGVALLGAQAERGTGRPVAVLADINVPRRHADAHYLAAMNPDVGRKLAALLRGIARWYEINSMAAWPHGVDNLRDLARAVLGETEARDG